jgi:beta-glucanase (GH16 family)
MSAASRFYWDCSPSGRKTPTFVEGGYNPPRMATASHGTRGSWLAVGALVAALAAGAGASAATASAATVAHSASKTNTMVLRGSAEAKGKYEIIVWVRSRSKHSRIVRVHLTGQRVQTVRADPWWGARVYYELKLEGTKLTIVTENAAPAVQVRARLISKNKSAPAPTITTTNSNAPSSASSTSTSTSSSGSGSGGGTTTAPPPPPPAADPYGPYTTLTWEDNFAQDFVNGASQPNQLPNSSYWNLDTWGGCGDNTLSTDVANSSGASLTSNGLALNATETSSGHWTAAQVDTGGKVSFSPGSTIEARIDMPTGQGLCPAFWMLGNDTSNQGEIDVVEAPSYGATADYAYFTIHGPGDPSQKYESDETALGSLSGAWHNYAVTWTSSEIIWSIDGVAYATANASSLAIGSSWTPFDGTFDLIFDTAVGGWPCADQPVGPGCEPPASSTMYVQWVKAFS